MEGNFFSELGVDVLRKKKTTKLSATEAQAQAESNVQLVRAEDKPTEPMRRQEFTL